MKKALLSTTTLALTLFLTMTVANAQPPQDIAKTAQASTVRLTMDNGNDGNGFFISPGHIAASYHVIKGASSGYASDLQKKNYPIVGIAAIEEYHDLVILKVSGAQGIPLRFGDSDKVKERDKIYIVGNSGTITTGERPKLIDSRKRQIRVEGVEQDKEFLISTANSPGDTGGPLLNDKGEVVGVLTEILDADNLNKNLYAAPSKYLWELVEKITKPESQRFLTPLSVKGVIGTDLTWGTQMLGADSYKFILSNQRNDNISNPYFLIIFKDEKGKIICTDQFMFGGIMFAGSRTLVPRRLISKATDHYYHPYRPYRPEKRDSLRRNGLDGWENRLVGPAVKQLMESYEIIIIDFDIDTLRDKRWNFQNTPNPLHGYMSAEASEQWLKDNHYKVQKEGNQYIITRDYYDPKTRTRDNSRFVLSDRATVGILDVTITIDAKGMVRVQKHRN